MITKVKDYGAASVLMEQTIGGLYAVRLRNGSELVDKVRCDTYRDALAYWSAFNAQAKTYAKPQRGD